MTKGLGPLRVKIATMSQAACPRWTINFGNADGTKAAEPRFRQASYTAQKKAHGFAILVTALLV